MQNLQDIFNRMQENKQKQKEIKALFRDAFANSSSFKAITEKLAAMKEDKKKIEETIKSDLRSEISKLDSLKLDWESDMMLISDLALTEFTKGNTIEIVDQYSNKYEPVFSVKFKKL